MRKGNKLIQEGKVPKKRTLNTQVLTDIVNGYYLDGIEAGYKAGYDKGYEDGARCQDEVQYQKGLEDMRDAFFTWLYIPTSERTAVFGVILLENTLKKYTAVEFFEKVKALKQKQEEAKERFREKLESGYFSGKQKQSCDNCIHNDKEWHSEPCDGCTLSDSHYVSASDPIESEKTVFPDSPCDLCVYNPPSSFDGKPCTMCPAEGRDKE